jgi:hypothetical protein
MAHLVQTKYLNMDILLRMGRWGRSPGNNETPTESKERLLMQSFLMQIFIDF